jgi:zinc protease
VDVAVWYRAGTRWEPARSSGLTHLLDRLMFDGSANVPDGEHARRILDVGGAANVTSGPDFSCFWQTLPPEALGTALRLEADRMASLSITADKLARAKRAARDDVQRRTESSALGRGLQRLYALAYPAHPYGRPLRGVDARRDAITLEAAKAWWGERYGPDGALLTVTGRFDPDTAMALARRTLGAVAKRPLPASAPAGAPPPADAVHASIRADAPLPLMIVGWRAPAATDSGRVALRALARLLGAGPGSRILRGLQRPEAPLALASDATASLRRDGSLLYVVTVAVPGADSAAVEGAAFVEAVRLVHETPSPDEVERVRAEVEMELRAERETVRGRATALGAAALVAGDWRAADHDLERAARLTGEQLRVMAGRVLQPEHAVVVWVWPEQATAVREGLR